MATLEKIRSKAVLLIVVIGVAMAAFILGDLFSSGTSFMGQSQREIAEINGHTVMIDEFQQRVEELSNIYKQNSQSQSLDAETVDQIHEQIWNGLIREKILGDEYDDLGIAVSEEELFDMVQGDNIHPIVRQMFANPETGQIDKSMILNFLKRMDADPAAKSYWLFMEKEIVNQRMSEKYNTLIAKGLYATTQEAEIVANNSANSKNIEFFSKPFSSVPDSLVTITDADIKSYYNTNKEKYKQEESRTVEYIEFNIEASEEDEQAILEWAEDAAKEITQISSVEEMARYVNLNSDTRFSGVYTAKEDVDPRLKEFVNEEKGSVYGPYKENNAYLVVNLFDVAMRPDSMKASHILIREASAEATQELADSIVGALKENKNQFAALVQKYSLDEGSAVQGGDLGWFKDGMMVKPFNDACIEAREGEIVTAQSQFGTHIINVEEKSKPIEKVLLARLSRNITPSTDTYRDVYSIASKFIGENNTYEKFLAAVEADNNIVKKFGRDLGKNDKKVNDLEDSREFVRWAYKSNVGDLSDIQEFGEKFVIAALVTKKEEGYRPVSEDAVKNMIRTELLREKKAEYIVADINAKKDGSQTLSSLAQKVGAEIKQANNITFNAYFIEGAGYEPALIGSVMKAEKDAISQPVKGTGGVYVYRVVSVSESTAPASVENQKQQITQSYTYRVDYQPFNALRENAEIEDGRSKFY